MSCMINIADRNRHLNGNCILKQNKIFHVIKVTSAKKCRIKDLQFRMVWEEIRIFLCLLSHRRKLPLSPDNETLRFLLRKKARVLGFGTWLLQLGQNCWVWLLRFVQAYGTSCAQATEHWWRANSALCLISEKWKLEMTLIQIRVFQRRLWLECKKQIHWFDASLEVDPDPHTCLLEWFLRLLACTLEAKWML